FAVRQSEPRETEVNRHLACLFFLKPVGIDAGESLDERGFAVVNMTGGTNKTHGVNESCTMRNPQRRITHGMCDENNTRAGAKQFASARVARITLPPVHPNALQIFVYGTRGRRGLFHFGAGAFV